MNNGKDEPTKSDHKDDHTVPMDQDQNAPNEMAGMSIKLQPFWPESPENWFLLAEIQFEMQKVTAENQRYLHTLAALPVSIHDRISDLLRAPPKDNKYTTLKNTILTRLSPSDERQLEKLLSGQEIGDRSPSDLLRHIRELARDSFPDKIIRSLWSRRMPEVIRIAIAAQPDTTSLNALAETADRMFEAMFAGQQQLAPIASTSRQSRPRQQSNSFPRDEHRIPSSNANTIEERLNRLEAKFDRFANNSRSRSTSSSRRFPSQSRFRSQSRKRSSSRNSSRPRGNCWYHQIFGTAARKCQKPCNFEQSTLTMDVDLHQKNQ